MLSTLMRWARPPHPLDNGGGDADPAYRAQLYEVRVRDWHWRINNMVLIMALFCLLIAWALSPKGLPMLGSIAWADGTDVKIRSVMAPLQSKIDKIEDQTRQMRDRQEAKDLTDLRQKLFETRVAQCEARTRGKGNPYTKQMSDLQGLHYALTRTYYAPSDCADL